MSELSPMLHQELSNAPMLGGDRTIVMCEFHNIPKLRDFFGNTVCVECSAHAQALADLRENPVCPNCKGTEYLSAELVCSDVRENVNNIERVIGVFCDECSQYAWIANDYANYDYNQQAYLVPGGRFDNWF